jgi:hypothetical protein
MDMKRHMLICLFISMEVGSKRSDVVRLGKDRLILNIQINITLLLYRLKKFLFYNIISIPILVVKYVDVDNKRSFWGS